MAKKIAGGVLLVLAALAFVVQVKMPPAENISETVGRLLPGMLLLIGAAWCFQKKPKV